SRSACRFQILPGKKLVEAKCDNSGKGLLHPRRLYMHRTARWMVAAAAMMVSASAWAGPLSLWVGQKQTLFIFSRISSIEISNPEAIRASRVPSVGMDLRAVAPGVSNVTIKCKDGSVYAFQVHVTRGAE